MPTWNNTGTGRTGSTQDWTVPKSGLWRITARGARGGWALDVNNSSVTNPGGNGAIIVGDFNLTAGHVIRMMVGQAGGDISRTDRGGGGGGGTFVFNVSTGTLLVAAGGGGGAGNYLNGTAKHASTGGTGQTGTVNGTAGAAGPNGAPGSQYAGGGGGYSGNGTNPQYISQGNAFGTSYTNGGLGGYSYQVNEGGDGGYGAGAGAYAGAGGGGGYGGGGAGGWSSSGDGGGGGSYNAGSNQSNTVGNYGHGQVTISGVATTPLAPGISTSAGTTTAGTAVTISWTHNDTADAEPDPQAQYELSYQQPGSTAWNLLTGTTQTSRAFTPTLDGLHYFRVRTYDNEAWSPYSATVTVNSQKAPSTPTNFAVTPNPCVVGQTVTFSWTHVDEADSQTQYELRYQAPGSTTWVVLTGTTAQSRAFVPTIDGKYNFQVRTYDNEFWSPFTGTLVLDSRSAPTAPTVVTATPNVVEIGNATTITWTHNDPGNDPQTRYQIRWRKIS